MGILTNQRTNLVVADRALDAQSMLARTVGLLGRANFEPGEALIIRHCNMVHMLFMRFAIDVAFCSADGLVLDTQELLKPWRMSKKIWKASYIVEFPAGTLAARDIRIGDSLQFSNEKK